MSDGERDDVGAGCGCILVVLLIAAVVFVLISLAALVDPFAWLPPVGEVWEECDDDLSTDRSECALEYRFPGFWLHAVVNLVYAAVALLLLIVFAGTVAELREKRTARFASADAAREYREARDLATGCGVGLAALALLPVVVAIA